MRATKPRWRLLPSLLAVALGLTFTAPAVWLLAGALRADEDTFASLYPVSWRTLVPVHPTLANFRNLWESGFGHALFVSVEVSVLSIVVGLLISAPAAYALGVLSFPGRNLVFAVTVIGFMVPFEAVAIPMAHQFQRFGLDNSLIGLVLPGIGNGLAIFNLRQFFSGVPTSLREAAAIDGASEPRILWSIYLPISGQALANSSILIFLGQWQAYLWPLLIVTNGKRQVAPVTLANTFSDHVAHFGQNFAGAVILAVIPAVLLFALQRVFGGLALTSGEK